MSFKKSKLSRRTFMQRSALAAAGTALAAHSTFQPATASESQGFFSPHRGLEEMTIAEMQAAMGNGELTSQQLVGMYLDRIDALDRNGPKLNSILELNPDALSIAVELDRERAAGNTRGPLHGIPIVIKDNIDTADKMLTTAGSLALVDSMPLQDSTMAAKLREAGAVIMAKTGLSEWANFRGFQSSSGWSGRGGQVKNPYIIDRNPCGSSSGSGTAVSANLAAASLGTETNGSIVCPSTATGLAGIKPTVGLTSRAGVIPISHTQDTIGPMARTVGDAAAVLGALTGVDERDPATEASADHLQSDYTQYLDPNGLEGARIGVARTGGFFGYSRETDWVIEQAIEMMRDLGAEIVDPANLPSAEDIATSPSGLEVLLYEFKADLNAYLETRSSGSPRTLAGLIEFNNEHFNEELQWFGQELFLLAEEKGPLTEQAYLDALETNMRLSRAEGIDAALAEYELDAIIAPTGSPAWPTDLINGDHFLGASSTPAAWAGYPLVTVPAGFVHGLPVGMTFMGTAWSEPTLIRLASGFEAGTLVRQAPTFQRTLMG